MWLQKFQRYKYVENHQPFQSIRLLPHVYVFLVETRVNNMPSEEIGFSLHDKHFISKNISQLKLEHLAIIYPACKGACQG